MAAKANPWYKDGETFNDPMAGLNAASVKEQLRASLGSLRWGRCLFKRLGRNIGYRTFMHGREDGFGYAAPM